MVRIYRPPNPDPTDDRYAVDHGIGLIEFNDRGAEWTEPQVPEGWVEMVRGEVPWTPLDRPVGNPGTHRSHCCAKHGCKYSASGCPVVSGELVQDHPCEQCEFDDEDESEVHQ